MLYDATTLITYFGEPDVSTLSDISIDNPRSSLTQSDVVHLMYRYGFPSYVKVQLPISHKRINWNVPGFFLMYELPF